MRGSASYMGGESPAGGGPSEVAAASSSNNEGQQQQQGTGTSATANGDGDALSAFDAFEELASVRSTASTSNIPAWK
jgi:hypothetical protein